MMQLHKTIHGELKMNIWAILVSVCIFLAGCDGQSKTQPPASAPVPEVSTITVKPGKIMLTQELPGRTSAYRMAQIRPQVSGIILKRLFKEGSDVKAGQVLYAIDPAPFQAEIDRATANHLALLKAADQARAALKASIADIDRLKATLELARTNRDRFEASFKDKIVSAMQRDQTVTEFKVAAATLAAAQAQVENRRGAVAAADAAIAQARAAMETAGINLGYCRVMAPISGRIGRSSVTEGAVVTAYQGVPLATIQQLDPIYADLPQSTNQLLRLKNSTLNATTPEQNKVQLLLGDNTPYPQEGTLQFSDVTVDPTTGSVILRVVVPNPDGTLLPGMFVRAVIKEGVDEQAILIPQQGVARDPRGNPFAMIVDSEGKAGLRMLTLDRAVDDQWIVDAGLAPGDRVIVEGLLMLRPGTPVKATDFHGPSPENGAMGSHPGSRPDAQPGPDAKSQKQNNGGM
ncbi:ArcA [Desulforapulum autotrophicum HRM2]|uniref:ArcA n=1 Tax=Desulforapulum autotrophicum (strain ATCC 43914 / DSM 3382 / VKM B-1955 / HRM2) TaxID=177437 RepID=C0QC59_DESAH|nr:efflux RND transporter periplasmic adaptor subunit [Desulforapulum autotrophicum]ACN17076.1 ArcA [Desulforapulum autotrophicum HRM2]